MQQLFPAEGKTTPDIRFPEFQNDGKWILGALQSLVAECLIASFVICLVGVISDMLFSLMSDEDIQGMSPFQYTSLDDDGVPPPIISHISNIGVLFHPSPSRNSGNRKAGTTVFIFLSFVITSIFISRQSRNFTASGQTFQ